MNGLRNFLHGNLYQWKLLTMVALQASEETQDFELISEDGHYRIFDDIVLIIGNNLICLQVKHRAREEGDDFTRGDLLNINGRLMLQRSYESWIRLNEVKSQKRNLIFGFVSNRDITGKDLFLEEINCPLLDKYLNGTPGNAYRFKQGEYIRRDFVNAINRDLQQPHNEDDINRFLDSLVFKIKQPSLQLIDEPLSETIKKIIRERKLNISESEFSHFSSFVLMKFELDILKWFANIDKYSLRGNEISGYLDSAIEDAVNLIHNNDSSFCSKFARILCCRY